eukprot:gene19118-21034_t
MSSKSGEVLNKYIPMYNDNPEAPYVCPYDPSHTVRASRMSQHLKKCRKNFGGNGFEICTFNALHHVPTRNFEKHLMTCPDKSVIQQDVERAQGLQKHYLPPVDHHPKWEQPEMTEDWEAEAEEHQQEEEQLHHAGVSINMETLVPERPANWDQMSASQKKNHTRRYTRQKRWMEENGVDLKRSENPEDWTEHEREAHMQAILSIYPPPNNKLDSKDIDYISVLNQYCQKNKINAPKYLEAGASYSGFSYEVIIKSDTFRSHGHHRNKMAAKKDSAKWALLNMKLPQDMNVVNRPRAIRPMEDQLRLREAHETGLLYQSGNLPARQPQQQIRQPQQQPNLRSHVAAPPGLAFNSQQAVLLSPDAFSASSSKQSAQTNQADMPALGRLSLDHQQPPVQSGVKQDDGWSTVVGKRQAGRGRGRGTAMANFY